MYIFGKRDLSFMSRIVITSKFKMRWFPNERRCWAGKLLTDIILVHLMPDEDKIFNSVALRIWWRRVHTLLTTTDHSNKMYLFKCENFGVDIRCPIILILFVTRFSRVFFFWLFSCVKQFISTRIVYVRNRTLN